MGRFARNMMARVSGSSVALSRLWPGRTDRLIIAPHDLRTADATRAAEIYAGRFVFAGKIVTCHGRSIFDHEPPSEDWEVALLGFGWLRHLRAADTALTRANARALVDDWTTNPNSTRPIARRADVLARRVISLLSQAPLMLGDTDGKFYRRYLRSLTREIRYLRLAMLDIPDGVPRLQVLIALCYASLCLANQARHVRSASKKLSDELQRQILPDGGHISRNPGALIELLIDLLPLRQTWATVIARAFTDPVFFFITEWFPIYLVAKGIELKSGLIAVWIPFIATDIGSFFAGGLSGYLVKRGWSLGAARKFPIVYGGIGMTLLIFTVFTSNLYLITLLFALVAFTYAGFTTMANVLPSDLFNSESVASVSGLSGTGAGIGTIVAFKLIGYVSDARQAMGTHSFDPILILAGLIPFVGMILVLLLLRNSGATDRGLVRRI